mmetsp:Transcript_63233/g.147283  ORF Transcript_63233/g.147283 Transcript_63233/m.147283 type:complete len:207 (-) Transcript_63233:1347-1967(-)
MDRLCSEASHHLHALCSFLSEGLLDILFSKRLLEHLLDVPFGLLEFVPQRRLLQILEHLRVSQCVAADHLLLQDLACNLHRSKLGGVCGCVRALLSRYGVRTPGDGTDDCSSQGCTRLHHIEDLLNIPHFGIKSLLLRLCHPLQVLTIYVPLRTIPEFLLCDPVLVCVRTGVLITGALCFPSAINGLHLLVPCRAVAEGVELWLCG